MEALRRRAYDAVSASQAKMRHVLVRKRCNDIKAYALKRANGHCECCGVKAPFLTKHGLPYLEVHHIKKLSDYGLDSPNNVAALTPNCHRRIHQGFDGADRDNELLKTILKRNYYAKTKCYKSYMILKYVYSKVHAVAALLIRWGCHKFYSEDIARINKEIDLYYKLYRSDYPNGMNPLLVKSLIVSEDRRFYTHKGFDLIGIARATLKTLFYKKLEGGSTIDQQFVRTILHMHDLKLSRKFKEVILASSSPFILKDRNEIPELYLYIAYYGWGMNGIKQALKRFRLTDELIDPKNAAKIISCLKHPLPHLPNKKMLIKHNRRMNHILSLMESDNGTFKS